jgi:mycothiol system anti-sigma-R factor
MGCADDGVDCAEVLEEVYDFLHAELAPDRMDAVRGHLGRCTHCEQQYDVEQAVQAMIARSCGCQAAPEELRARILQRITQIEISGTSVSGPTGFYARATFRMSTRAMEPDPGLDG